MDGLLGIIVAALAIGLIVYLVGLAPIDDRIKRAVQAVVIFVLIVIVIRYVWPMTGLGG